VIDKKEGFREVWYVWDGDYENAPRDFTGVKQRDGVLISGSKLKYTTDCDFMHLDPDDEDSLTDIIAYTTGQMRRRVECDLCKNTGLFCHEGLGCVVCPRCNGKGYLWEYK
jgi:hypothetical protein